MRRYTGLHAQRIMADRATIKFFRLSQTIAFIDLAKSAYQKGATDFLIDMSDLNFMSSAGLVALLSIIKLMSGESLPDPEHGWDALHEIHRTRDHGVQQHVKLLKPLPNVDKVLKMSGMKKFFEIFAEKQAAIASFG